jgi:hypothetical protein
MTSHYQKDNPFEVEGRVMTMPLNKFEEECLSFLKIEGTIQRPESKMYLLLSEAVRLKRQFEDKVS